MKDEVREYLEDILKEACNIKEFIVGKDFEQYSNDRLLKAGVERKFEIIGEALNRIKSNDEDILIEIRDYRSIISFRNILAHGYDIVEDKVVWGIIENDLDMLIGDIEMLLAK
jgi:uncharacterized protein with HEPN domain